jgi:hypothetical protein
MLQGARRALPSPRRGIGYIGPPGGLYGPGLSTDVDAGRTPRHGGAELELALDRED